MHINNAYVTMFLHVCEISLFKVIGELINESL